MHAVKYVAIGLSFHLVGDIFAHRTMIPASYSEKIENKSFKGEDNKSHNVFKITKEKFNDDDNKPLIKYITKKKFRDEDKEISDEDKNKYITLQGLKVACKTTYLESRDIKLFSDYHESGNTNYKSKVNIFFEDNTSFYKARYNSACAAVEHIAGNFTSKGKFYLDLTYLIPDSKGLKLNMYKSLLTKYKKIYNENGVYQKIDSDFDPNAISIDGSWEDFSFDKS